MQNGATSLERVCKGLFNAHLLALLWKYKSCFPDFDVAQRVLSPICIYLEPEAATH